MTLDELIEELIFRKYLYGGELPIRILSGYSVEVFYCEKQGAGEIVIREAFGDLDEEDVG